MGTRSRHYVRTFVWVALAVVSALCLLIVLTMLPGNFGPVEFAAVLGLAVATAWGATRVRSTERAR